MVPGLPGNPPDAISIDHRLDADPGPRFIYQDYRHALPQFVAGLKYGHDSGNSLRGRDGHHHPLDALRE